MAENEIRIKDLPSTQQINETDDVIVLDNATDGTRKLQGKVLLDMIHSAMAKGTASGAVATFTDGSDGIPMTDLVVSIEPQQDLHGYDSPWVGGAGKNKLENATSLGSRTINGVTITTREDGSLLFNGTSTGAVNFIINSNVQLPDNTYILSIDTTMPTNSIIAVNTSDGNKTTQDSVTFTGSVNGNVWIYVGQEGVVFNNIVLKPMIRLASVTDATFAPYSNICPISGWTACNVVRTGKNLFDKDSASLNKALGWNTGIEFAENNSWVSGYISVKPSVSYKCNKTISQLFGYDESKTCVAVYYNGEWVTPTSSFDVTSAFTVPSYIKYIRFSRRNTSGASADVADTQLEIGTQSTTYEEYNGNTYTINFVDGSNPLIVYGGTLDVLSGLLTVDRGQYTIDENQQNITIQSSESYGTVFRMVTGQSCIQNNTQISNRFKFDNNAWQINSNRIGTFVLGSEGNLYVQAPPSVGTTVDALRTWLTSHNIQINYELATPQTYQLTSTEVKSLLGVNNIFADTGNVLNAEYVRDTTTIINQILARLDALES